MSPKRTDYISWDRYFMGVALMSAQRSKDPNTQVGACIVNRKNRIVGIGYNGFPHGVSDDEFPWEASEKFTESKYPYVVHAEPNAILNANAPVDDCVIYVTLFPCHECVKLIIQSGIKEIVYLSDKYNNTDSDVAAKRMLDAAGIKYRKIPPFKVEIKDEK
ncbi:MAG TPA: dCMP deaminase family protein [Acholeplasmataceae bacterium]|jgi:dCMP deaminase|nr:dCMP deaminase family protein [Acholeplasmataceae bacterium]